MRRALLSCVSALVLAPAAEARVVEWEVLRREPTFEGRSFGNVGPYEKDRPISPAAMAGS